MAAATASGDDGNAPDNTRDGELGTRWSAEGREQRIRWDLGDVREITHLRAGGTVSDVTLRNIRWEVPRAVDLIGEHLSDVRFDGGTVAGKSPEPGDVRRKDGPTGVAFAP